MRGTLAKPVHLLLLFMGLGSFSLSYSQSGQWTWVKGSSGVEQPPSYGNLGVPESNNTPGARRGSAYWKDNSGNFWLFGGYRVDTDILLNDLWKYDPGTNRWVWISGTTAPNSFGVFGTQGTPDAANYPGARVDAMNWVDLSGNFWLFGGYGMASTGSRGILNDLWKYNPATNQWTWIKGSNATHQVSVYGTKGVPAAGNMPGARDGSATWTDASGNLWLLGGLGFPGVPGTYNLNDLWRYNPSTNQWTWMGGSNTPTHPNGTYGTQGVGSTANTPGGRHAAINWKDAAGNFWLLGGNGYGATGVSSGAGWLNDLWKYEPSTGKWTWMGGSNAHNQVGSYGTLGVASASNMPGARWYGGAWTDATGKLWLFGGQGYSNSSSLVDLNDLWKYDPQFNQWTWIGGSSGMAEAGSYGTIGTPSPANKPGARNFPACWTDASNNLWLFGGLGFGGSFAYGGLSDLWKYSTPVLPLLLHSFSATLNQKTVDTKWVTTNEVNVSRFEVQYSNNGSDFSLFGTLKATNTAGMHSYHLSEKLPGVSAAVIYFRLKMVDNDGKFTYSNIVEVKLHNNDPIPVYPNPATRQIAVPVDLAYLELYSTHGKLVAKKTNLKAGEAFNISSLANGVYLLKMQPSKGLTITKQLVVNN